MTGDMGIVPRRWLVLSLVCVVAVAAACARRRGPSVADVMNAASRLTPGESVRVLEAARTAIAGKHGRLISAADAAAGRPGMEFSIAPNGRLQFLRWSGGMVGGSISADGTTTTWSRDVTVIVQLTGRPARGCDGTSRSGPLVVEYRNEGDGWLATARTRVFPASPTPLDDFLAGDLRVDSDELEMIGARPARVFVAQWMSPASDASPNLATGPEYRSDDGGRTWTKPPPSDPPRLTQSLWVDSESLLPLQWGVMYAADPEHGIPARPFNVFSIRYVDEGGLQPPPGTPPPDCVP